MISLYFPWLLSAITIYMMVMAGNLHKKAWMLGMLNQALWLIWILATSQWGFLPMNIALWVVCIRNHLAWNKPYG